jgi:hypothetical protein
VKLAFVVGSALALVTLSETCVAQSPVSDPRIGTTDPSGRLILHVFTSEGAEPILVPLSSDYGIMMFRATDGARFTLADRRSGSVREFTNYDHFLKALSALPKGSTLHVYDRCTVPLFMDFYPVHKELYRKFRTDARGRSLNISAESKITCTCEQHG